MISRKEISEEWAKRITVFVAGLEALKYRLPPILQGKSKTDMARIIQNEIRELRSDYARNGRYCHANGLLEKIVRFLKKENGEKGYEKLEN